MRSKIGFILCIIFLLTITALAQEGDGEVTSPKKSRLTSLSGGLMYWHWMKIIAFIPS